MNGHDSMLLYLIIISMWRGESPEITVVAKSVICDELENMYFVGYVALPTGLHNSHVAL